MAVSSLRNRHNDDILSKLDCFILKINYTIPAICLIDDPMILKSFNKF